MNILQVTELYKMGGLEKFIDALSSGLQQNGDRTFLAIGDYEPPARTEPKGQDGIYVDFGFKDGPEQSVESFLLDVERLCEIIEENEIECVLIHPFYSLFPALAAAKISKVPTAYVIHGVYSCSFSMTSIVNAFFRVSVDCSVNHIFVTQKYFQDFIFSDTPTSILRNPICGIAARDDKSSLLRTKRWALCSRLDEGKEKAIRDLFSMLSFLDISHLDIYGSGSSEGSLKEYAEKIGIGNILTWHGYREDWLEHSKEADCGVIGLGRVAIEALAAGLPVILLGVEGGICGLVDSALFDKSKDGNFGKIGIPVIGSATDLNSQLRRFRSNPGAYLLDKETRALFSQEEVAKECLRAFGGIAQSGGTKRVPEWINFIDELRALEVKGERFSTFPGFADALFSSFISSVPFGTARNSLFVMNERASIDSLYSQSLVATERLDAISYFAGEQSKIVADLGRTQEEISGRIDAVERLVSQLNNMPPVRFARFLRRGLKRKRLKG